MSKKADFFVLPHILAGLPIDQPVLVAFSGGADSSALLQLLCESRKTHNFKLYAAHVNHNIRTDGYGNEAERDEQFCRSTCQKLDVELFVKSVDVPAVAKQSGKSPELAARDARYAFFAEIMSKKGIKILVTAHNADDNLETQIFNLARGCSIEGIAGIPPVRTLDGVNGGVAVRPILSASKAEILDFCEREGVDFVTDSTNLETDCTRNRIRHNVIPELVDLFGTPQRASVRLSRAASEDADFILGRACEFVEANGYEPTVSLLSSLHKAVAKRVVSLCFAEVSNKTLESVHIDAVISLIEAGREYSSISLPDKKRAVIRGGKLIFTNDGKEAEPESEDFCVSLLDGLNVIASTDFAVLVSPKESLPDTVTHGGAEYVILTHALIKNADKSTLIARNRRSGQTVTDGGMNKKIKKLMCDSHIDRSDRASIPLIHSGDNIIYVPLCAVADCVRATTHDFEYCIGIYRKR